MTLSLSSPPVAGVWWAHTLDWLYVSLSSPPVAGVWWAHTLDCLYDSLSSPPVAGVWWAHTLDWLYDSLSSPPVAGVWRAHTLDWPLSGGSCRIIQVDAAHWWWFRRVPPPPMIVKRFGRTAIHKALYRCIIHLFNIIFQACPVARSCMKRITSHNRHNTQMSNHLWPQPGNLRRARLTSALVVDALGSGI